MKQVSSVLELIEDVDQGMRDFGRVPEIPGISGVAGKFSKGGLSEPPPFPFGYATRNRDFRLGKLGKISRV
jgi:hypothetical protein